MDVQLSKELSLSNYKYIQGVYLSTVRNNLKGGAMGMRSVCDIRFYMMLLRDPDDPNLMMFFD